MRRLLNLLVSGDGVVCGLDVVRGDEPCSVKVARRRAAAATTPPASTTGTTTAMSSASSPLPGQHTGDEPDDDAAHRNLVCPGCPDGPWVVQAEVTVDSDVTVIKNCACRRILISARHHWIKCEGTDQDYPPKQQRVRPASRPRSIAPPRPSRPKPGRVAPPRTSSEAPKAGKRWK
jgi:hypothetical protein